MPYIKEALRDSTKPPHSSGELNYQITELVNDYIAARGLSYHIINETIGVLECAKLELYRRIATNYEDKKIAENGDVYSKSIGGWAK